MEGEVTFIPWSTEKPRPKRRKVSHIALACEQCSSAHAKCDGNSPCSRCNTRGLHCRYVSKTKSSYACDYCKQKHRKCDGDGSLQCSTCRDAGRKCAYAGSYAEEVPKATSQNLSVTKTNSRQSRDNMTNVFPSDNAEPFFDFSPDTRNRDRFIFQADKLQCLLRNIFQTNRVSQPETGWNDVVQSIFTSRRTYNCDSKYYEGDPGFEGNNFADLPLQDFMFGQGQNSHPMQYSVYPQMLTYYDAYVVGLYLILGKPIEFGVEQYKEMMACTVTPQNALNYAVVTMGALLLEDKERARSFARVTRKLIEDLEKNGPHLLTSCAMFLYGDYCFMADHDESYYYFTTAATTLESVPQEDRSINFAYVLNIARAIMGWVCGTLNGDPKAVSSCSVLFSADSLAYVSNWQALLTEFGKMSDEEIPPMERDFFSALILDGAVTSLPLQKSRLFSISGEGRNATKEIQDELNFIIPFTERIFPPPDNTSIVTATMTIKEQQRRIRLAVVRAVGRALLMMLSGKTEEALASAIDCLDYTKHFSPRLLPTVVVGTFVHLVHVFLLTSRMDKLSELIQFFYKYGRASDRSERVARDLQVTFFGPKEVVDVIFNAHAFSPILVLYRDMSTKMLVIDKFVPVGGEHVISLLEEREAMFKACLRIPSLSIGLGPRLNFYTAGACRNTDSALPGISVRDKYIMNSANSSHAPYQTTFSNTMGASASTGIRTRSRVNERMTDSDFSESGHIVEVFDSELGDDKNTQTQAKSPNQGRSSRSAQGPQSPNQLRSSRSLSAQTLTSQPSPGQALTGQPQKNSGQVPGLGLLHSTPGQLQPNSGQALGLDLHAPPSGQPQQGPVSLSLNLHAIPSSQQNPVQAVSPRSTPSPSFMQVQALSPRTNPSPGMIQSPTQVQSPSQIRSARPAQALSQDQNSNSSSSGVGVGLGSVSLPLGNSASPELTGFAPFPKSMNPSQQSYPYNFSSSNMMGTPSGVPSLSVSSIPSPSIPSTSIPSPSPSIPSPTGLASSPTGLVPSPTGRVPSPPGPSPTSSGLASGTDLNFGNNYYTPYMCAAGCTSNCVCPPGSVPPGSVPPGSVPPGSVPPGSVPSGGVSSGGVPPQTGINTLSPTFHQVPAFSGSHSFTSTHNINTSTSTNTNTNIGASVSANASTNTNVNTNMNANVNTNLNINTNTSTITNTSNTTVNMNTSINANIHSHSQNFSNNQPPLVSSDHISNAIPNTTNVTPNASVTSNVTTNSTDAATNASQGTTEVGHSSTPSKSDLLQQVLAQMSLLVKQQEEARDEIKELKQQMTTLTEENAALRRQAQAKFLNSRHPSSADASGLPDTPQPEGGHRQRLLLPLPSSPSPFPPRGRRLDSEDEDFFYNNELNSPSSTFW
eukprot:TRINITY_DN2712_c0_g8_i1.p1 TRINITY_DN2712_c0_g8~~TRINITY_DN2712_c0_g8_i1.p1  ORF type:complete len:1380 (+),score=214.12 TRINITY_DN2712_c0_g8_i1:269-4408(+)